jgi:hypothetical protein
MSAGAAGEVAGAVGAGGGGAGGAWTRRAGSAAGVDVVVRLAHIATAVESRVASDVACTVGADRASVRGHGTGVARGSARSDARVGFAFGSAFVEALAARGPTDFCRPTRGVRIGRGCAGHTRGSARCGVRIRNAIAAAVVRACGAVAPACLVFQDADAVAESGTVGAFGTTLRSVAGCLATHGDWAWRAPGPARGWIDVLSTSSTASMKSRRASQQAGVPVTRCLAMRRGRTGHAIGAARADAGGIDANAIARVLPRGTLVVASDG